LFYAEKLKQRSLIKIAGTTEFYPGNYGYRLVKRFQANVQGMGK
jgi:hypothetical protein